MHRLLMRLFQKQTAAPRLAEYLFVDRPRLHSYMDQIKGPVFREKIPTWNVDFSAVGPKVTGSQKSEGRAFTDHEMIDVLVNHLKGNSLLAFSRPQHHHDVDQAFVLERMVATKAIFKASESRLPDPLKGIAVWASDPPASALNGSQYSEGTFLYLVEAYWDSDRPCSTTFSGFSALNAIVTELKDKSVLVDVPLPFLTGHKISQRLPEDISRLNWLSPIDTLRTLGAQVQPPRHVESLYRKRYLSDEQAFRDSSGQMHRSNDLFAYPIYICDDVH